MFWKLMKLLDLFINDKLKLILSVALSIKWRENVPIMFYEGKLSCD